MSKRSCSFGPDLQEKYKFMKKTKSDSHIRCQICNTEFNIASRGSSDIVRHLESKKHRDALNAVSSSEKISKFCGNLAKPDHEMLIREGVWAYHTLKENHSFASSDCATKIFKTVFAMPKFSCARTKCEAIITRVLAPFIKKQVLEELNGCNFVSLTTDASNHGHIKMFPVLVRYFLPTQGIKVKTIEFSAENGETSEIIYKLLKKTCDSYDLIKKLVAFCGDNAAANFGGITRGGDNNVFHRLRELNENLIGIACCAHTVHNALETACQEMPFDVECVVVKIYSHFYRYTVRVDKLKSFCESVEIEYNNLLGYSKTRFLALQSAVGSIIKMFPALKEYFLSSDKPPKILKLFFEDPLSKMWLIFVRDQAENFNKTVLKIEGENVSFHETAGHFSDLMENILSRKRNKFIPTDMENEIETICANGDDLDMELINGTVLEFYDASYKYLAKYYQHIARIFPNNDTSILNWLSLRTKPEWNPIKSTMKMLSNHGYFDASTHDSSLFVQFGYVDKYITTQKIDEWAKLNTTCEQRWIEIFRHFDRSFVPFKEIATLVEFGLSLPGTSAPAERVFSSINKMWTTEKTQLQIETLKSMIFVKQNFDLSCLEFQSFLKANPKLVEQIGSQEKYQWN